MLLASLGTSIANVGLPTIARDFDAPFSHVQWIVLAYLIAVTAGVVLAGPIGDAVGRRRTLMFGLALFSLASVACGIAPNLTTLVAARAAQGTGAAAMLALTMAFATDIGVPARTGRTMGLLGATSAIGTTIGPVLGGVLIATMGWHAIFLVNVPLGVLALTLIHRYLPEDSAPAPRASAPGRVRVAGLRSPVLVLGFVMSFVVSTVMMATLIVGPFYLAGALDLSAALVGAVMSVGPAVAALVSIPAGRWVDRLGSTRVTRIGLVMMLLGALVLSVAPSRFGITGYITPLVLLTSGYAQFQTANNAAVMTAATPATRGTVSGLVNLSRNLGLIAGASAMAAVFALGTRTSDVAHARPAALATGMHVAFAAAAALLTTALLLSAALPRHRIPRETTT
jgi:MFS family permease